MNMTNLELEPVTFQFVADQDKEPPSGLVPPRQVSTHSVYESCGPESLVIFSYAALDKSDVIVKTTVRDIKKGTSSTIFLVPTTRNGHVVLEVGYYMCDRGFALKGNEDYEVSFVFQDICGNVSSKAFDHILFTSPETPRF
jgi:uncharacterized protein YkuJ